MVPLTFGGKNYTTHNPSVRSDCRGPAFTMEMFSFQPPSSAGLQLPLCLDPDPLFQKLHTYCYGAVCLQVLPACVFVCVFTCLFVYSWCHCIKPDCSCAVLKHNLLGIAIDTYSFLFLKKINVFNCF